MRILVDMDGVLSDFEKGFIRRWKEKHPDKRVFEPEERKGFYIIDQYPKEWKPLIVEIRSEPGFFYNLEPVPGGLSAVREMAEMDWEVFICSSPMLSHEYCATEKYRWVEKHLGREWKKRVILTKDKTVIKANILIDDRPDVKGSENPPSWEHVLYDRPYNRDVKGKRRLTWSDWKEIIAS